MMHANNYFFIYFSFFFYFDPLLSNRKLKLNAVFLKYSVTDGFHFPLAKYVMLGASDCEVLYFS